MLRVDEGTCKASCRSERSPGRLGICLMCQQAVAACQQCIEKYLGLMDPRQLYLRLQDHTWIQISAKRLAFVLAWAVALSLSIFSETPWGTLKP